MLVSMLLVDRMQELPSLMWSTDYESSRQILDYVYFLMYSYDLQNWHVNSTLYLAHFWVNLILLMDHITNYTYDLTPDNRGFPFVGLPK